jgi:hypothetical protein
MLRSRHTASAVKSHIYQRNAAMAQLFRHNYQLTFATLRTTVGGLGQHDWGITQRKRPEQEDTGQTNNYCSKARPRPWSGQIVLPKEPRKSLLFELSNPYLDSRFVEPRLVTLGIERADH